MRMVLLRFIACLQVFLWHCLTLSRGVESFTLPSTQYNALHDLYLSTQGADWQWQTANTQNGFPWNFSISSTGVPLANPCSSSRPWQGLDCSSTCQVVPCAVIALHLKQFSLRGRIPSSISHLTSLQSLDLSHNSINGSLPATLGSLSRLQTLILNRNQLHSTIPQSFSKLTALRILNLFDNRLNGTIPDIFTSMSALVELNLYANDLSGSLPTSIQYLSKLELLDVSLNPLHTTIPNWIGHLSSLRDFSTFNAQLTGTLPNSIGNCSQLKALIVYNNSLHGTLPWALGNCSQIEELLIQFNKFTGSIPVTWAQLERAKELLLNDNLLTGSLPELSSSSLTQINVQGNHLTGSIPWSFAQCYNMVQFSLVGNHFSGTLEAVWWNYSQLQTLNIGENLFYGSVPDNFTRLTRLLSLDLDSNALDHRLPLTLQSSSSLGYLIVNQNQFTGELLGNTSYWRQLALLTADHNYFTSTMPASVCTNDKLSQWIASNNLLSGSLPSACSIPHSISFATLIDLQLSNNLLTGTLPESLIQSNLQILYLDNNRLSGVITEKCFAHSVNLSVLILAINCFTGTLPVTLCLSTQLKQVTLDGLHSASICEKRIWPWASSGLTLSQQVYGSIPDCFFHNYNTSSSTLTPRDNLIRLQMAGNALSGSIPVLQMPQLRELSLSNNLLRGTVPTDVWDGKVSSVDLSFNRLLDEIPSNAYASSINANSMANSSTANLSLSLQVNRLSGHIAAGVRALTSINLLEGNLFACSQDRSDLPAHDPQQHTYSCGSSSTNVALTVTVSILVLCTVLPVLLVYSFRALSTSSPTVTPSVVQSLLTLYDSYLAYQQEPSLERIRIALYPLSRLAIGVALFLLVLCLPLYIWLGMQYSTLDNAYIWVSSCAFIQGIPAGVTLFILFILFVIGYSWEIPVRSTTIFIDRSSSLIHAAYAPVVSRVSVFVFFYIGIAVLINGSYVMAISRNAVDAKTKSLLSIVLSLYKILWMNILLQSVSAPSSSSSSLNPLDKNSVQQNWFHRWNLRLSFDAVIVISSINNVLVPFLAETLVSPNCLLYAVQHAPDVHIAIPQIACTGGILCSPQTCVDIFNCREAVERALSSTETPESSYSFIPPFHYSFQCSSSLTATFVSVYFYRCLWQVLFQLWLLLAVTCDWDNPQHRFAPLLRFWITSGLKLYRSSALTTESDSLWHKAMTRLVLGLVTDASVLLSFGVLFPPLGIVVALVMLLRMSVHRVVVGRAYRSPNGQQRPGESLHTQKCKDSQSQSLASDAEREEFKDSIFAVAESSIVGGLWLALTFGATLWAWAVFDALGDEHSTLQAMGFAIALVFWPMVCYLFKYGYGRYQRQPLSTKTETETETVDIELKGINSTETAAAAAHCTNPIHDL